MRQDHIIYLTVGVMTSNDRVIFRYQGKEESAVQVGQMETPLAKECVV